MRFLNCCYALTPKPSHMHLTFLDFVRENDMDREQTIIKPLYARNLDYNLMKWVFHLN